MRSSNFHFAIHCTALSSIHLHQLEISNNSNLILSYNLVWTYLLVHTLESRIDVGEGINVAPGTFEQTYVEKKKKKNLRNMEEKSKFW